MADRVPLGAQIAELELALPLLRSALANEVNKNRIRAAERDLRMSRLEAIGATLRWLREHEAQIREDVREARP